MQRLTREQRRQQTRDRLLEAGQRLFAQRGLTASLDDVAAAAGLTKGAVYANFDSKEDLVLAIIDRRLTNPPAPDLGPVVADPSTPPEDRLAALGKGYADALTRPETRDFALLMIEFWVQAMRNERVRAKYAEAMAAIRAKVAEELTELLDASALPAPATQLAALMCALDTGLAVQHLVDPAGVPGELYGVGCGLLVGEAFKR